MQHPKVEIEFTMDFPPFWEKGDRRKVKAKHAETLVAANWAQHVDKKPIPRGEK